jgi:hypothetical protein
MGRRSDALRLLGPPGCPCDDHPDVRAIRGEIEQGEWDPIPDDDGDATVA